MGRCKFECGGMMPLEQMTRLNQHGLWTCKLCHNTEVCLTRLASKNPEQRDAVAKMKSDNPAKWAEKIRACRIYEGGTKSVDGKTALVEAITEVIQFITVKACGGIKWMTAHAFAVHQKKHFGWDEEASNAEFKRRAEAAGGKQAMRCHPLDATPM